MVLLVCGIQLSGGITGLWNAAVWKLMGTANWCISTKDTVEQLSGGITGVWHTTIWWYYWYIGTATWSYREID